MFKPRTVSLAAAFAALFCATTVPATAEPDAKSDVMLVLDVSNSMWGQIDGVSKIEIAREVIADLMLDWDASTHLGLVAYGHRREGDCSDIETVVPVGPVDAESFIAQVNNLIPRGRTPLTASVMQAAQDLSYADRPATVILVSDGIETCNADPCALAAELERTGVAFTAHVVGFDVADPEEQAQLACIAENTGGLYLSASNAEELGSALANVRESLPQAPVNSLIAFEALDAASGIIIEQGVSWTVVSLDDESNVLTDAVEARPELELDEGTYVVIARTETAEGQVQFDVVLGEDSVQRVRLESILPEATVSVENAEIPAGSEFPVTWTGPDGRNDYVTIVQAGADEGRHLDYGYTRDGSPLPIRAPDETGAYEVRYVSGTGGATLASIPVTVVPAQATLDAVDEDVAGASVAVTWTGPDNPNDYITIVPVDADEGTYWDYEYTRTGSPLPVRLPDEPGTYEIRYVSGEGGATFASRTIVATPAEATLEAPDSAIVGSQIAVTWTGPDNQSDYITIVPAGADEGTYLDYAYTREGPVLNLTVPDEIGAFEIRYVTGQSAMTLASVPISLVDTSATLDAADSIVAGADVSVTWTGPDNRSDYITIVPVGAEEGSYINYTRTSQGSPLTVLAPDMPGVYEIRYVLDESGRTLASRPLTLTGAEASLEAPDTALAGSDIRVAWAGPDNRSDYITIVPVGAEEGSFTNYTRTSQGSPLTVLAPDEPGDYEIRYVSNQSGQTLASRPLSLTATSATLESVDTAVAGSDVVVTWTGPDNRSDYITIVPVGAEEGSFTNYTRTSQGSPLTVLAPAEPGDYEIRYVSNQSGQTVASRPLTLTATSATLQAVDTAVAGADIVVTWTGPDNRSDYITIVPVGAEEGSYINYTRTNQGSPLSVLAPDEPGDYEIRYVSNQSGATVASRPLTLTAATATLEAVDTAVAGADVVVTWTGPDNRSDYITIVPVGAEEGSYTNYTRTSQGSPLTVQAPDAIGAYEIRYVSNQSGETITSRPLTLTAATATLEAVETAVAGADIIVTWTGPDNRSDYITIVPVGAEEGSYVNYTRTNQGNPLSVQAPDEAGEYEIRYVSNQSGRTVASAPLTLTAPTVTLDAVDKVEPGADVVVTWTGPDNRSDYITIVPVGAEEGSYIGYTRTSRGNPLSIAAPDEPGQYEVRYVSNQSGTTLASRPITVTAP